MGAEKVGWRNVRAYVQRSVKDPIYGLAAIIIGTFTASAIWGVSPFPALGAMGFIAASVEWALLARWWLRQGRTANQFEVSCGRVLDLRQFATLTVILIVTLAIEVWLQAQTGGGILERGLSVFGLSTLLVVWHAWSKPMLIGQEGLMIGVDHIAWSEVEAVTFTDEDRGTRVVIELRRDHHIFRKTIVGVTSPEQARRVSRWMPTLLEGQAS